MSNLSKNIISKDGPTNDLERLVSNMSGSEYPVEPTFGLGKEIKKIAQNGSSSSGGVPEANEEGLVLTTGTNGNKITIIDADITTPILHSGDDPYQGTWAGFDESLIKWPEIYEPDQMVGTVDGHEIVYNIKTYEDNIHYIGTTWGNNGVIRFFPDGTFEAEVVEGKTGAADPEALDSWFFLGIDKIEPVWAPIPEGTVTTTASADFVGSHANSTLDMTATEIMAALKKGPVFVRYNTDGDLGAQIYQYGIVMHMEKRDRMGAPYYFRVLTYYNGAPVEAVFTTSLPTGYPVCSGT
jgi:hypothetical protein